MVKRDDGQQDLKELLMSKQDLKKLRKYEKEEKLRKDLLKKNRQIHLLPRRRDNLTRGMPKDWLHWVI